MSVRLNKFLADRGVASRRASDRLIEQGRVRINGRVVSDLGTKVEEQRDRVSVDGKPIGGRERHVYFVLNKPVGVITTLNDPEGRRTVKQLLPRGARVYPVGRLDADTSGLLLLTNDGELAHKLMHPRYGVAKVYRVRLAREPRPDQLRRLSTGVRFDRNQVSGPARARRIDPGFDAIMIEVVVHEGRFRQVRKMCEAVGLEVTGLHRVGYGPIRLGPLARGMFRELSEEEVAKLRAESARGSRPAPRSATRTAPPARPRPAPAEEEAADDTVEETWVPGGGFLEPEEEGDSERPSRPAGRPSEWPARATARRGDADFRATDRASRGPGRATRGSEQGSRGPGRTTRGSEQGSRGPGRTTRSSGQGSRGPGQTTRSSGQGSRGPRQATRSNGQGSGRPGRTTRGSGQGGRGTARRDGPPRRPRGRFAENVTSGRQRRVGTRNPSRRRPR